MGDMMSYSSKFPKAFLCYFRTIFSPFKFSMQNAAECPTPLPKEMNKTIILRHLNYCIIVTSVRASSRFFHPPHPLLQWQRVRAV